MERVTQLLNSMHQPKIKFFKDLDTYLTDNEKSPGDDSLILIKNPPSGLFCNNFSASALVILP